MRLSIFFLSIFALSGSCIETKRILTYIPNPDNYGISTASSLAADGITSYLIVPLTKGKYAIATNYALCSVLIEGRFNGKECSEKINQFYESGRLLEISDIADVAYFDVIDLELLETYLSRDPSVLIDEMYDHNCIPVNEGVLSHSSVKAAALIIAGVSLVQTEYHDFELSTSTCELYRKAP
jgi:hypothetical protein